jgi:RNA polymerase sigma-70 factor (ECF subfamily)
VDYAKLDDTALIRQIVYHRTEALSELYDRYSRLVFSLALQTIGDPATAEEITQDVFVRVWEKAGTYREEQAKVSTWLTSITRYRSIDLLRQRGSRPERDSIGWDDLASGNEPSIDGPEGAAELSIEGLRIRNAVNGLPPDQQKALRLAYFYGLSHSEIAEQLGEPLGTVKTRIRLAMQKLREILQDDVLARR